ncbi:Levanase [Dyadobacter sp. CECT 9275]|uniref:Levanase n=1 Tax=Dyadobacter helix TaxID=2822344 RepID=A0A916JEV6_9BACT|nr:glycoside hydrolase family 32 protein [Dyadobacter sp. CECT 9275]CAG5002073.1 Levanase [Dyadobacter sp. CECT 9275]
MSGIEITTRKSIMKMIRTFLILFFTCLGLSLSQAADITIKITNRYLNLPVSQKQNRGTMQFEVGGKQERAFKIRLAADPEYWVFCDMAALRGQTIKISYDGHAAGLDKIYQADQIAGQDSLYREKNRPQFHFTSRRGWNNDPNGLIFYEGEYHLFYQHNPYEKEWENMSWGHAVSEDMLHWKELPTALSPDHLGTMFSGSTVIDYNNTAGFNKGNTPAMVAVYTADSPEKEVQCIAYSLDKGRTWTKYDQNPVIDSKAKWNSKDTRDPRVFWYKPGKHWVLVLNERDGHTIYTSKNLKDWKAESHVTGFWECPDLFELPVDGDRSKTKWVMYGASNTYMVGSFDGKTFRPESGKHYYTTGTIYAAQTFTNIPESDGRRIQIGWGRVSHPGMPFNGMMLLPTELTLQTTKNGVRLFSVPVKETGKLFKLIHQWPVLAAAEANNKLKEFKDTDRLRIKTTIKLSHATSAGLSLFGQNILNYDLNFNLVNGVFYSPEDMTSAEITADIYIDRTSIEVFIDGGAYSYSLERRAAQGNKEGFQFWGNAIEVKGLDVYSADTIWK